MTRRRSKRHLAAIAQAHRTVADTHRAWAATLTDHDLTSSLDGDTDTKTVWPTSMFGGVATVTHPQPEDIDPEDIVGMGA